MSGTTCLTSGLRTADAQIYTGKGTLNSLSVYTDGTNAATVTLYDNTAASGTVLAQLKCIGANFTMTQEFNLAIRCNTGIYADVTGTGAGYIVHFGG